MKKPSLLVIFLTVFIDLIGFGIVLPLLPQYSEQFGAEGWEIGFIIASFSLMQLVFAPVWGRLSDRIGRRPVMITGCIAAIIAIYPILLLIASGNVLGVLLGFVIAMPLVQAAMYGPLAAFTTEIFATGNRYTGASLGYQLSSTLGGGFAPLIAATLVAGTTAGNGLFRVALFAAAAALISAITIAIAKESSRRNLVAAR